MAQYGLPGALYSSLIFYGSAVVAGAGRAKAKPRPAAE